MKLVWRLVARRFTCKSRPRIFPLLNRLTRRMVLPHWLLQAQATWCHPSPAFGVRLNPDVHLASGLPRNAMMSARSCASGTE
jgi:hypothetical protein